MPHNPILTKQTLGRLAPGYKIPQNTVGVLCRGKQKPRLLQAGESVGWSERLTAKDALLLIVDISPQFLTWRATLPTKGDKDYFSTTINLRYKVTDAQRMVDENITDTEQLLIHTLEPYLRRTSRRYSLDEHGDADRDLEAGIIEGGLGDCGLKLIDPPNLVIHLSEADHRRIRELQAEKRALRAARVAEHQEDVPSKEGAFRFRVKVSVTYQVKNRDEMPSESLEESEQQLWPKMRRALWRTGQEYKLTEITLADQTMQKMLDNLLDEGKLDGFGLSVVETQVTTDLDEAMRRQFIELAEEQHRGALEEARLKGMEYSIDFYTGLVKKGSLAAAAVAVSKGEINVDTLYERLTAQEQKMLELQLELLDKFRAVDMKDESQDYELSQKLAQSITQKVMGTPAAPQGPALPEGGAVTPQLPATPGETSEFNPETSSEGT